MRNQYYVDEGGILCYPDRRIMSPADAAAKINSLVEDNTRYRDRLQIDPGGSDKIDELRTAQDFMQHDIEMLTEAITRLLCHVPDHPDAAYEQDIEFAKKYAK